MRHSIVVCWTLIVLASLPSACAENDGVLLSPDPNDAGDSATAQPDAAADGDAVSDADAAPEGPTCSAAGFCRTELPTSEVLYSLWGTSDGSLWAGGSRSVFHWDGTSWKQAFAWPEGGAPGIRAKILVGTGPEDVWAFGDGTQFSGLNRTPAIARLARRGTDLAWRSVTSDISIQVETNGTAWAASPTDLVLAWGYQGLWQLHGEDANGHVAAERVLDPGGEPRLFSPSGVWGFGADRVFASGNDMNDSPRLFRRKQDGSWTDALALSPFLQAWRLGGTREGDARLWAYDGNSTSLRGVTAAGELLAPELQRTPSDSPSCRGNIFAVVRSDLAWMSDGRTVCRYRNGVFELVAITVGDYPRFTVHALWSNGIDTWVVGEEKPKVGGGLRRGFALRLEEGKR